MKAVILAGGGGTRLWPLSKEDFPKQFLSFGSELSLLQKTVQRLLKSECINDLVIATNTHHRPLVELQLKKIGVNCPILIEPLRRNTAPAVGLAVKYLESHTSFQENEPILIVPSDHLLEPDLIFLSLLEQIQKAPPLYHILTFGIRPTKPETGYGYIEIGKKFNPWAFQAIRFVEKPDLPTAEKYINNSHFFWNSGMFLFSAPTFWKQLQLHSPSLYTLFSLPFSEVVNRFAEMPDLSLDYAIMEKSTDILLCPLAVTWSDVGSWDSVYEIMEKDAHQNVKIGEVLSIDTTNSLILGGKRIISTIGLDDLLIIETDEAILISKKGESQRVKALLQELQRKNQFRE